MSRRAQVTTVSPTYAREVLGPSLGMGLQGILQRHAEKMAGVLNGLDYEVRRHHVRVHLQCADGPNHALDFAVSASVVAKPCRSCTF